MTSPVKSSDVNASNIKKCLRLHLILVTRLMKTESIDDEEFWCDDEVNVEEIVGPTRPSASHLRCFVHCLQLAIKDALHRTRSL
jgi:hypothetical protein